MINFGEKIRELRKLKNLKQKDLAKILNVTLGTIGMYETNRAKPSHEVLQQIAEYFDISMDELYGMDS